MCSSKRAINNLVPLIISAGPATLAVARESKRQRVAEQMPRESKSFDLDSLFRSVPLNEDSFPSIEWAFDDETDEQPTKKHLSCDSFFSENGKRNRDGAFYGIHRSKAMLTGLSALLEEEQGQSTESSINSRPITPVSIKPLVSSLLDQFTVINSVSLPSLSRKITSDATLALGRFKSSNTLRGMVKESLIDFDAGKKQGIASTA